MPDGAPEHRLVEHLFSFIEIEDVGTDIATESESKIIKWLHRKSMTLAHCDYEQALSKRNQRKLAGHSLCREFA